MFCESLEKTLNAANQYACSHGHSFITLEHLLYVLMDNAEANQLIVSIGASAEAVKREVSLYLEKQDQISDKEIHNLQVEHTDAFKRVIQRSIFHAQTLGKTQVDGSFVLAALLSESDSHAFYILQQEGVNKIMLHQKMSSDRQNFDLSQQHSIDLPAHSQVSEVEGDESVVKQYATNLNEEVMLGRIDPVIGRKDEIIRLEQVLCRRRKNNPILVGESGVGKTAIAEGLAWQIVQKKIHPMLANSIVYSVDMGALLAGTKYRGDFEKRFKAVLNEFTKLKNAVIFIDEIHTLIGAGSASGGSIDAANLLKPLLTKGDLRCIGATTFTEYRQLFEKDHALSRRFQKIDIKEPSKAHTLEILRGLKTRFENHHNVHYSLSALKAAIELSVRYMHDRHLPDKAVDVIDEAGAAKSMGSYKNNKSRQVDVRDIEKVVASLTQIPTAHVVASDKAMLKHLERDLNMVIYGQSAAINHISTAIKLSKSGLGDPNKPIGSFLFSGPTGVGKTELARQLASSLNLKLLRFDMSEFMEKHSASQLVGSPPGYVGFDQGGQLTEAVAKNPYSVLLLDEIEKAHHDIFNLLLQVMDHGMLTDNSGRTTSFRNVIIIMTSNCGAVEQSKNGFGFTNEAKSFSAQKAVEEGFSPEFRNRLDAMVMFNPLHVNNIAQIVDKFLSEFEVQLQSQGVDLCVSKMAKNYLIEHGYDVAMGARPMSRLINKKLKKPLADALLFGSIKSGDTANVCVKNNDIVVDVERKKLPKQQNVSNDS
ncbi:MAG: AAA family ATPase [Pseudomonadota bacterium]|nr:AAA family ATPase [Pseudomonadota bacterium]